MELYIPTVLEDDLVVRLSSKIKYKENPKFILSLEKQLKSSLIISTRWKLNILQCWQTSQQAAFSERAVTT